MSLHSACSTSIALYPDCLPLLRAHTQTGIVVEVARALDCALSGGELRRGVPSRALRPVLRFQLDQHVLHASGFLGRIDDVRGLACP